MSRFFSRIAELIKENAIKMSLHGYDELANDNIWMKKKQQTKIVPEGKYLAEVDVELIETDQDWSPFLSLQDAYKLDDVREALKNDDLKKALQISKVYFLKPVAV